MAIVGERFEARRVLRPGADPRGRDAPRRSATLVKPHLVGRRRRAQARQGPPRHGPGRHPRHRQGHRPLHARRERLRGPRPRRRRPGRDVRRRRSGPTSPTVVALSGFLTLSYDAMRDTVAALDAAGLRDRREDHDRRRRPSTSRSASSPAPTPSGSTPWPPSTWPRAGRRQAEMTRTYRPGSIPTWPRRPRQLLVERATRIRTAYAMGSRTASRSRMPARLLRGRARRRQPRRPVPRPRAPDAACVEAAALRFGPDESLGPVARPAAQRRARRPDDASGRAGRSRDDSSLPVRRARVHEGRGLRRRSSRTRPTGRSGPTCRARSASSRASRTCRRSGMSLVRLLQHPSTCPPSRPAGPGGVRGDAQGRRRRR